MDSNAIALVFLAHLTGDYLFQNSWMAYQKKKTWLPAIVHGIVYGLAFVITGLVFDVPEFYDLGNLLLIVGSHIPIDHYAVASIWVRAYNNDWEGDVPKTPFWVMLVVDQAMHLWINVLCIVF